MLLNTVIDKYSILFYVELSLNLSKIDTSRSSFVIFLTFQSTFITWNFFITKASLKFGIIWCWGNPGFTYNPQTHALGGPFILYRAVTEIVCHICVQIINVDGTTNSSTDGSNHLSILGQHFLLSLLKLLLIYTMLICLMTVCLLRQFP